MLYYIYKIENLKNHKKYIGLTNNYLRRKNRHFNDLRHNHHDNKFLQKEFNIYGEENFSFEQIFCGDVTIEEIGQKEQEYIKFYDSYKNGYNQNEGGDFGPSNGGSHLIHDDIINILAACHFTEQSMHLLGEMFDVSATTIYRINKGVNHVEWFKEFQLMTEEEKRAIYERFNKENNFEYILLLRKNLRNRSKRALSDDQVRKILANKEFSIIMQKDIAKYFHVAIGTIKAIEYGESYQDVFFTYKQMPIELRQQIAANFREEVSELFELLETPNR